MMGPLFYSPDDDRLGSVAGRDEGEGTVVDLGGRTDGMYLRATVSAGRIGTLFVFAAAAFGLLAARSFYLQVWSGAKFGSLAQSNSVRTVRAEAARGIIFDTRGEPLVRNAPSFAVSVTGADLPQDASRLVAVSSTLARYGISSDEWQSALTASKRTPFEAVPIANRLSHEQAISLTVESARLPGITVDVSTRRDYLPDRPAPQSLAHVLGYVGKISDTEFDELSSSGYHLNDRIGKSGLESTLETVLRGRPGYKEIEVDAFGRERRIVSVEQPKNGTNVMLTIDAEAQAALERSLRNGLAMARKTKGVAIAMDPRDGSVIAMASLPAYDPNVWSGGISTEDYSRLVNDPDRPLYQRAVSGQYPSGSTFKPVVAIAALAEGIITPKTSIMSTGGIWYLKKWFFPDWKAGGHGATNVYKAIAESVNTFFYTIGGGTDAFKGLGPDKIAEYAARFGFGKKTGIEEPGEADGLIPTPAWKEETRGQEWFIGDTYHMAIGQGDVLVTPIQMASMNASIANGGTVWKPHLVKATYDPVSKSWNDIKPQKAIENPDLQSEVKILQAAMRQTVTAGSARSLMSVPVAVAGKTGTAQFASDKPTHAWFIGFAPAEAPTVAVTVLIEEGGEGSSVAVPVAKEFLNWYFGNR